MNTPEIIINPKYHDLDDFIRAVPDTFEKEGTVIYDQRNKLKVYTQGTLKIIVKRFRLPLLINRIVYAWLRPSKAKRSYKYAFRLLEKGISTPDPIACLEDKSGGLLGYSYYVCIYENEASHIREEMTNETIDSLFLKDLAHFIAKIHNQGILFRDLSPGNILFKKTEKGLHFFLIDINRMSFKKSISIKKRYQNFGRISGNPLIIKKLAKYYAETESLDVNKTIKGINKACSDHYDRMGHPNPFKPNYHP